MISTELHPWNPRLLWILGPSLLGGMCWWLLARVVLHGEVRWQQADATTIVGFAVLGVVTLAAWLGPILIAAYLVQSRAVHGAIAIVASAPMLLFFPLTGWTFLAFAGAIGGIWWSLTQGANEVYNRLQLRPYQFLSQLAPITTTVIMAVVSVLYFQQIHQSATSPQKLANSLVDQSVTIVEKILPAVYHAYQPTMTVDQFLVSQVPDTSTILKTLNVNISQPVENISLSRAELDQSRNELAQRLGVKLRSDESMHEALVAFVNKQYQPYVNRYLNFIPPLLAVALFFLLRVISVFFQWAVMGYGWLFYRLLRLIHAVKVDHITVPAERLVWIP